MKSKQFIAVGSLILFTSCNVSNSDEIGFKVKDTPEQRAWDAGREERLARDLAFFEENKEAVKIILQNKIINKRNGGTILYFDKPDIGEFMQQKVPKGLPGEGLKYYESLVIKKKGDADFGYEIEATLTVPSDDKIWLKNYEASIWKAGDDNPPELHTWNLLQKRVQHTKELMKHLMYMAGDVSDESMPSKFNYTVIVVRSGVEPFELGRRVKRCEKFGLAHLPFVEGRLKASWYSLNKRRQQ